MNLLGGSNNFNAIDSFLMLAALNNIEVQVVPDFCAHSGNELLNKNISTAGT